MKTTIAFVIGCVGLAGAARAQNALGDGRALERSPQVGAGGRNLVPTRDFAAEIRFRNALVTGNVPGGLSFRGDVGYTDPFDFRDRLGSDTLFAFRRDSFYSGLAGQGLRGTDALQYQAALTTGGVVPTTLAGSMIMPRNLQDRAVRTEATGERAPTESQRVLAPRPLEEQIDQRGLALWSLRSPSASMASRTLQPATLGLMEQEGKYWSVEASPLLGVRPVPFSPVQKQEEEEARPRPGQVDSGLQDMTAPTRENVYKQMVERIRARAEAGESEGPEAPMPDWQRKLEELRERLGTPPGQRDQGETGAEPDEKTLDALREGPGEIPMLVTPDENLDLYAEHMSRGEELLMAGRFFDAEERFIRALAARPEDPMAQVGRIHAQLGAGMYRSAAVNLRSLLTKRPELAGARFADELLPKPERASRLSEQLRRYIDGDDELAGEMGLLLAYLGYQLEERNDLRDGLAALNRADADGKDELARFLTDLWSPPPEPDS